jgi:hypothetical protein
LVRMGRLFQVCFLPTGGEFKFRIGGLKIKVRGGRGW